MCSFKGLLLPNLFPQIWQGIPVLIKQAKFQMENFYMFKKFENKTVNIHFGYLPAGAEHNLKVIVNGNNLIHCWQLNRNGYTMNNAWSQSVLCVVCHLEPYRLRESCTGILLRLRCAETSWGHVVGNCSKLHPSSLGLNNEVKLKNATEPLQTQNFNN